MLPKDLQMCSDKVIVYVQLKVLPKDLQMCTDKATGVDSLGQFQFGDLVQIEYVYMDYFSNVTL